MKKNPGLWLACGAMVVSTAVGSGPPLLLDGGPIETAGAAQQEMFRLVNSSPRAPSHCGCWQDYLVWQPPDDDDDVDEHADATHGYEN